MRKCMAGNGLCVSCRSRFGPGIVARAAQMRRWRLSSASRGAWVRRVDGREAGGRPVCMTVLVTSATGRIGGR
jgi:hypothetical protein